MSDLRDKGFISRFFGAFGRRLHLDKGGESAAAALMQTVSGEAVTPQSALKLSAVWACVRLRAQTVSTLPLHLRHSDGTPATEHPLYSLLHDTPNADMSASEFWEAVTAAQDLWGNAYALIHRAGGKVVALEPLDAECMAVSRSKSGEIDYLYTKGGRKERFAEDDMLHFRGFTLDGLVGQSPIAYAAESIGSQTAANKAAASEFKNGLKAGGFLETGERVLNNEQRNQLREGLARFSRSENAGGYMVLEAGMKLSANNNRLNPADAQLLESRHFGIEEICRAFAVPPQLIGHTDKASSWASSLDATNMGFLTYAIRPLLVRYEQTIARKLLDPSERSLYRPKFSVEGLLRTDSGARAEFYAKLLQNGVVSRNYVRSLEDLPPVEDGDELTVQVNMTTLRQLGRQAPQQTNQTEADHED